MQNGMFIFMLTEYMKGLERGKFSSARTGVSNLGSPDVLKFAEAFPTSYAGQDFWELYSKNIWEPLS